MSSSDASPPIEARRKAQDLFGRVARGERIRREGVPRRATTEVLCRSPMRRCFGDWLARPLEGISRRDVEARFHLITGKNGWAVANQSMSLLRSACRRPCADREGLRNPVDLWFAAGRGGRPGDAGHLPDRHAHRDAPGRDHLPAMGPGGP